MHMSLSLTCAHYISVLPYLELPRQKKIPQDFQLQAVYLMELIRYSSLLSFLFYFLYFICLLGQHKL